MNYNKNNKRTTREWGKFFDAIFLCLSQAQKWLIFHEKGREERYLTLLTLRFLSIQGEEYNFSFARRNGGKNKTRICKEWFISRHFFMLHAVALSFPPCTAFNTRWDVAASYHHQHSLLLLLIFAHTKNTFHSPALEDDNRKVAQLVFLLFSAPLRLRFTAKWYLIRSIVKRATPKSHPKKSCCAIHRLMMLMLMLLSLYIKTSRLQFNIILFFIHLKVKCGG